MEKIIETYKKQIFEYLGKRVENNKCIYCGKQLKPADERSIAGEYCDCRKSAQKNRFYKKGFDKIVDLLNYEVCSCDLRDVRNRFVSLYSIPKKFEGMDFDSYIIESDSEQKGFNTVVEYNKNAVKNYISGMNLIFLGKYGTGKTMLMSILCESLAYEYLFYCKYVNTVDFIHKIHATFSSDTNKTAQSVINEYKTPNFLFLDDIDKIKPSDYVREIFYAVINYRSERELPTIVSANSNLEELDKNYFGEAIVSRLVQNSKIINFTHKNKRLEDKC